MCEPDRRGTFALDGQTYHVGVNSPPSSLHGGIDGFDHKVWTATAVPSTHDSVGVELHCTSPDLDEGFPGALSVDVTYTLTNRNALELGYRATTSKPTVVNLTNHTYWNLSGEDSGPIDGHLLRLNASNYTPLDETLIPTGEIAPVAGSELDFSRSVAIGARRYDHNFVLDRAPGSAELIEAASVFDPASGRILDVLTTEPGIQLYTGNFLDGTLAGTSGRLYRQGDGLALETQHFPDSPNQPSFPHDGAQPRRDLHLDDRLSPLGRESVRGVERPGEGSRNGGRELVARGEVVEVTRAAQHAGADVLVEVAGEPLDHEADLRDHTL